MWMDMCRYFWSYPKARCVYGLLKLSRLAMVYSR